MTLTKMLADRLDERDALYSRRALVVKRGLADFCTNDYLGIVRNRVLNALPAGEHQTGSTGSRLLSGNCEVMELTELLAAQALKAESALIFNSGYDANIGLFSALGQRTVTILYDELSHASTRDGIRLSVARSAHFRHNDLQDLEDKLRRAAGSCVVSVESVYSMDGDRAPLGELVSLCERYGAELIVDEAHATGVFGERGEGCVVQHGFEKRVFARIHTFGKACGVHGAAVVGSNLLREYLINFARSFIYTTALPPTAYELMGRALSLVAARTDLRATLSRNIATLQARTEGLLAIQSPIVTLQIPGNQQVKRASQSLERMGMDVRPILSPTVREGQERLRICVHAHNTEEEIGCLAHWVRENYTPESAQSPLDSDFAAGAI